MGGVETDLDGRTSVEGLFAAGEAAWTGVHGANRLASNSLLEGLVFGARAAAAMTGPLRAPAPSRVVCADVPASVSGSDVPAAYQVRDLMWRFAGLLRASRDLAPAVAQLASWRAATEERRRESHRRDLRRLASLVTVGYLIARAALRREESRGGHFRTDFPTRDDIHWRKHFGDVLRNQ
jgi:L-aspartate oxidase